MADQGHFAKDDIERIIADLEDLWDQLMRQLESSSKRIQHELKLAAWREKVQKMMVWIDEKAPAAESDNYGDSIGEVTALKDAFERLENEVNGFKGTLDDLKAESEQVELCDEYSVLEERWLKLNEAIEKRRAGLNKAFMVATFLDESKAVKTFLRQKNDFLTQHPIPDAIDELELTLRNHERAFQELKCYQGKITSLTDKCEEIDDLKCRETAQSMADMFAEVNAEFAAHEEKIKDALSRQKLHVATDKLVNWCETMLDALQKTNPPENIAQAKEIINEHSQHRNEVNGNQTKKQELCAEADKLDMPEQREALTKAMDSLVSALDEKDALYQESLSHFKLCDEAEEKCAWLGDLTAMINAEQGTGLENAEVVEVSQGKASSYRNLLNQEEKQIQELLDAENFFDPERLETVKKALKEAQTEATEKLDGRINELEKAAQRHKFSTAAAELNEAINQKRSACASCDARDLSDLTSKIQSNQNLRSEIVAHQPKMDAVNEMGAALAEDEQMQKILGDVQDNWDRLQVEVHEKGVELEEATAAAAFIRGRDELEAWLDEIEPQVQSKEFAKDLTSAKQLASQHGALVEAVNNQQPSVELLQGQLAELNEKENFMAPELSEKTQSLKSRYEALKVPLDERNDKLATAINDLTLLQDINEQSQNTAEQETLLSSDFKPKDIVSAEAALLKNANLKSEVISNQAAIEKLNADADKSENAEVKQAAEALIAERAKLLEAIDERDNELKNKVQSFQYISDANEANDYIAERLKELKTEQVGSDEDEADALLKKHQTLCDDLNAFEKRINGLEEQRKQCAMQEVELESDKTDMKVIEPYQAQLKSEISVQEGDIVQLLSNPGGEWVKVQSGPAQGYVPAQCLAHAEDKSSEKEVLDLVAIQDKLKADFAELHETSETRKAELEKQNTVFELEREADDLKQWIKVQENALQKAKESGKDPETLRQKFEQFQKDQKQAEKVFEGLRQKADQAGLKESASLQAMEEEWVTLENKAVDTESQIGGASKLKQFLGEAGQLGAWIKKKNQTADEPESLKETKARLRRQVQLEGDMAAIEERLETLNGQKEKLVSEIPESEEQVASALGALNVEWDNLKKQQEDNRNMLDETLKYQEYNESAQSLENWLNNEAAVFDRFDVSTDLATIDAQKAQHEEHATLIKAKKSELGALEEQAKSVTGHNEAVNATTEKLKAKVEALEDQWAKVNHQIDEGGRLARFERDCERVDHWMDVRQQTLSADNDPQNVQLMIKKHEDFDRAIKMQESKMNALEEDAKQLIGDQHSAADLVQKRHEEIMTRWEQLKKDLVKKNKEVGEVQTLQEFWKLAEDYDEWLDEKIVIAQQPINEQHLNQGIQRHNAFLSEIKANEDRLENILNAGSAIVEQNAEQAHLINEKTTSLKEKFTELDEACVSKTRQYEDAELIRSFIGGCKALEFWLIETRSKISDMDGKDAKTADHELKSLIAIKQEFHIKSELKDEMKTRAESDNLTETDVTITRLEGMFDEVLVLTTKKHDELEAIIARFNLIQDLTEQCDWCKDKIVLASKEETGVDLAQAESYSTKHKRLLHEVDSKGVKIVGLISKGAEMNENERSAELKATWEELNASMEKRRAKISATLDELSFQSAVSEEIAWSTEKVLLLNNIETQDNLDAIRDQLQKLDALKIDLDAHQGRAKRLEEKNPSDENVEVMKKKIGELNEKYGEVKGEFDQKEAFLQYKRRCQNGLDWINDRLARLENENMAADDMSKIISSFTKQDQLEDSLKTYQVGIDQTKAMHDQLLADNNPCSEEVKSKWESISTAWQELDKAVAARREKLNNASEELKSHQDLCIQFARLASSFNTWYEIVVENLTDPVRSRSVEEAETRNSEHGSYADQIQAEEAKLDQLRELHQRIKRETGSDKNPYTWFTIEELEDIWNETQRLLEERQEDLKAELERQKNYDQKRKQFADFANKFAEFISSVRVQLNGLNKGTLEDQLAEVVKQEKVIREGRHDLNLVESLHKELEAVLVFDNAYTSHSALGLSQSWDGLLQMCSRMQISVKAQIDARSRTGIPEERLQEWKDGFSYFDKEQKGRLDYIEIKSLFRSLGIELALKEGDQESEEFVEILNTINPTIEGAVTKEEFINYMINRETSQVKGKQDIFDAFQAISNTELPYITKQELQANLTPTQVNYCLRVMPRYEGADAPLNLEAYDYRKFVKLQFN